MYWKSPRSKNRGEIFESKTISFPIQKILLGKTNEKRIEFQKSRGENFESKTMRFPKKKLFKKTNEKRTEFQKSGGRVKSVEVEKNFSIYSFSKCQFYFVCVEHLDIFNPIYKTGVS